MAFSKEETIYEQTPYTNALDLPDDIKCAPVALLSRSKNIIARQLDLESPIADNEGYFRDWRGLAMRMDFDDYDIQQFKQQPQKTLYILDKWTKLNPDGTACVKILLEHIKALRCINLLTNQIFIEAIAEDVKASKRRQENEEQELQLIKQRQGRCLRQMDQNGPTLQQLRPEFFSKEAKNELINGDKAGYLKCFDALICYAPQDILFVKKMLKRLERQNLSVCVDEKDFIAGSYKHYLTARVMEERCKKIILVVSPDFLRTAMCEFQTEYALSITSGSRDKKVLPVMYKSCDVPPGLKHLSFLSYCNPDFKEWFWPKLEGSIKQSLQWNADSDHERSDWGSISMKYQDSTSISKSDILNKTKRRHRNRTPSNSPSASAMPDRQKSSGITTGVSSLC